jgi:hypothetical protein
MAKKPKTYTLPAKLQGKPFHKEYQECIKCHQVFPYTLEHFALNTSANTNANSIYLRTDCRTCNKKMNQGHRKAKKLAGNPSDPPLGTCCDRCGCDPGPKKTDPNSAALVFDHCHETLAHRGWLCDNCNRAMGMLGDDITGQVLSAVYIAKTTGKSKSDVMTILEGLWSS